MLNTSNKKRESIWINKQELLITSLKLQPLIVVLRPTKEDFNNHFANGPLFKDIEQLNLEGIKHVEIGWSPEKEWINLIKEIQKKFPTLYLGASSITSSLALSSVAQAGISYAMSPVWDQSLQKQAQELNQVLIPGVFSPSEIQKAINFGNRIIKLFPASTLGINYLKQLQAPIHSFPFVIAAGGLVSKDIKEWLNAGYDAIALGRGLMNKKKFEPDLKTWLKSYE